MNTLSKILGSFLFPAVVSLQVSASTSLQNGWMALIKAELPAKCQVSIIKIDAVIAGKNGLRDEQWLVRTCKGNRQYWVYYYPPSLFPGRVSPYAVVRVHAKN